jgi:two-component system sensor histidine kinase CpxA
MKLAVHSLFLKIFLWFWATVIATGIALIFTFILVPQSAPSQWHTALVESGRNPGLVAVELAERDGIYAASAYIEQMERGTHLQACLFDLSGGAIAGNNCGSFKNMTSRVAVSKSPDFNMRYGIAHIALLVKGRSGREYIYATELPEGPGFLFGTHRTVILRLWGVAFLVSGFICYLLTRYITSPILHLRGVSQQLAAGDLSTRAAAAIERRHDELGDLVRDFNAMAGQIQELVSRQRQLISDISHELRSPLARLNVALDLGRERKGNDSAFDHMEQDLSLLNNLIERLLTVARLDSTSAPVAMKPLNMTELVEQIARDADFESHDRGGRVRFTAQEEIHVRGNAVLLHSAVENIVRNAICYGGLDGTVDVSLERDGRDASSVRLIVRDCGPGVPESELVNIFQPFYRVTDARDRQSGGTGLGLAIADRVIRIHGGTIRAEKAEPHGLLVEIALPCLPLNSSALEQDS